MRRHAHDARLLRTDRSELYLHENEFVGLFGMEKKDFYSMRLWKQRELKKRVGLF